MDEVTVREVHLKMNDEVQSLDGIIKEILERDLNSQILIQTKIYEKIFGIMNMGPKDSYVYSKINNAEKESTKIQISYFCEGFSKITLYNCKSFKYNCAKVGMNQIIIVCAD